MKSRNALLFLGVLIVIAFLVPPIFAFGGEPAVVPLGTWSGQLSNMSTLTIVIKSATDDKARVILTASTSPTVNRPINQENEWIWIAEKKMLKGNYQLEGFPDGTVRNVELTLQDDGTFAVKWFGRGVVSGILKRN